MASTKANIMVPNRLGWVTDLNFQHLNNVVDVTAMGDNGSQYTVASSEVKIDLTIHAPGSRVLMDMMRNWMHEGLMAPSFQKEFMCLYCASPNRVEETHCQKCGAPRSFVLG